MSLEAPQTQENGREKLRVKMYIQTELIKRYTGMDHPDNEHAFEWIAKYSAKFRDIFSQKLIDEPNFLEVFENDKETYIVEFENILKDQ